MNHLIDTVISSDKTKKKTPNDYYVSSRFTVTEINGKKRLVKKCNPEICFVGIEDIFEVISNAHISCGHGGQKRTLYELKRNQKVANVTATQVNLFITLCLTCKKKQLRNNRDKSKVISPIISSKFNERAQVDLVDMSSLPVRGYKYIFVYQDHLTKFSLLYPLKSKKSITVYNCLLKIITTFGCPTILQSDNGNEFCRNKDLKKHWPQLKIIKSKPRHPQSQGSIERANGDITTILKCWLDEHCTNDWVKALPFVQLQKNSAINRTIKCCPYRAVFGQDPLPLHSLSEESDQSDEICNSPVTNVSLDNSQEILNVDSDGEASHTVVTTTTSTTTRVVDMWALEGEAVSNSNNSLELSLDNNDDTVYNITALDNVTNTLANLEEEPLENVASTSTDHLDAIRQDVSKSLHLAAKKSIAQNKKIQSTILELGTLVAIKVPPCDLQKLSFRNLILSIYEYVKDIDKYRLQTLCKTRIVDGYFDKREFVDVYHHLNISTIVLDNNNNNNNNNSLPIVSSLRTIVRLDNYKFIGCQCSGRCQGNICFCKKVGKYCNPELCKHKHECNCLNKKYVKNVKTRNQR